MISISTDLCVSLIVIILGYIIYRIGDYIILPKIINSGIKEIEKNPKWITSKLSQYYGFADVDIILATSKYCTLPKCRVQQSRIEVLVPEDISTKDIEELGQAILISKLKINYNLQCNLDKPLYWLSILLYMLDGGDINIANNTEVKKE